MVTVVPDPTKPTRAQLARIADGDNRLLLALERLFEAGGRELPQDIADLTLRVNTAELMALAKVPKDALPVQPGIVYVQDISDLPPASGGVIQLDDNATYFLTGTVDLEGNYLEGGQNSVIIGGSSENARLVSTGLGAATALLQSEYTVILRDLTLDGNSGRILDLDASGNADQVLTWFGVNFENTDDLGAVANYDNLIGSTLGFLGVSGLELDGTIGTVAFTDTLLSGTGTGAIITIPSTATISRRFRVAYSAVIVPSGGTGLDVSASATVPVEGYILDTVNFSGAGTYLAGLDYTDNEARFTENRGITNTSVVSGYYMLNNATATTISATSTPVKAAGTTTESSISQKFDNTTSNRATYEGAIDRNFAVSVVATLSSTSNNQLGLYIAKNGSTVASGVSLVTAGSGGRVESAYAQALVALSDTDYIEVFVENNTAANDITVETMTLIVREV